MARMRLILVLALVAAACSDTVTTTSEPPTPSGSVTSALATTAAPTTTSPTTTTPTTTTPEAPEAPALLVSNLEGAFLVEEDFLFQLVEGPVEIAIDDGEGGLVFQRPFDFTTLDPLATVVYYLPPDSFESRDLLVPTGQQYLTLHDVAYGDVWYTRREGDTPETARETLRAYDLEARTVDEVAITGGWESGVGNVSVGYELIVMDWFAEAISGFDVLNLGGALVGIDADPYRNGELFCGDGELYDIDAGEFTGRGCLESPALGDDGTLAYIERAFAADGVRFSLVVVAVETGTEVLRLDLDRPDQGWVPDSVEITTDWVLVNRRAGGEFGSTFIEALLIERATSRGIEAGLAGRATLLTGPMAIS